MPNYSSDDIRSVFECRTCGQETSRKWFCSDRDAIKFAEIYAQVGYSLQSGRPQPTWTTKSSKDNDGN